MNDDNDDFVLDFAITLELPAAGSSAPSPSPR